MSNKSATGTSSPGRPARAPRLIERLFTGISGCQTGGQGVKDISLSELVNGNSFSSWPLNLPGAGSQTETTINVPYRFLGITEQLSWLAQFSGQGYEDISALASLIMLQEMMLGEEYMLIAGSSSNLSAPAAPTVTKRTAGSNETTVGANTYYKVFVTATNFFGETVQSSVGDASATTSGQVVDVTIVPVQGAMNYNIYVSTQSSASTANEYLAATRCRRHQVHAAGHPALQWRDPAGGGLGYGCVDPVRGCHPHPVRPVRRGGNLPDVADDVAGRLLQQQRRARTCPTARSTRH